MANDATLAMRMQKRVGYEGPHKQTVPHGYPLTERRFKLSRPLYSLHENQWEWDIHRSLRELLDGQRSRTGDARVFPRQVLGHIAHKLQRGGFGPFLHYNTIQGFALRWELLFDTHLGS
jgi:hypothetical protein